MGAIVITFVIVAILVYVAYVFYTNAQLPQYNEDGSASDYYDAFGKPTVSGYLNWIRDGMPNLGVGIRETFKLGDWWWLILLIIAVYLMKNNGKRYL